MTIFGPKIILQHFVNSQNIICMTNLQTKSYDRLWGWAVLW